MVYIFPLPYPDETLYSIIARYQVWSGNTNSKSLLRELYGKDTIVASKHLPSNIKELRGHLPNWYKLNEDDLINKTTLYKYYLAFSDDEKANLIYKQMIGNEGSKIFSTLGLSNNSINNSNSLKYCRECFKEDKGKYGEAYWHREHQLAGILLCCKHESSLYEIDNKDIKNRQEFINLNYISLPEKKLVENIEAPFIMKQFLLIKNSNRILNKIWGHKNMNFFREYYIKGLVEMGISDGRNKINQDILHERFIQHYGEDYLKLIGCQLRVGDNNSWLTKITRKHRTFFHPLYHLLLIDFLEIDIERLFKNSDLNMGGKNNKVTKRGEDEVITYRDKWLELLKNNSDATKSALRKIDCSTYTMLYRYDKDWLELNSPKKNRSQGIKIIDWEKRDEVLLKKIKGAVSGIVDSKDKPQRITSGAIGREINGVYILQKYLNKIPKSKKYLEENIETLEQFQSRRIKWVKCNCFKDELLSDWKVIRKAGIR